MLNIRLTHERRSRIMANGLVLIVAFVGFFRFQFKPDEPTLISKLIVQMVAPMQQGVTKVRLNILAFYDHYLNVVNTSKENEFLRSKVSELSQEIFELTSLKNENERLKQLMIFGEKIPYKKVLGQVIGWDASTEYKILRIDKGSEDGITVKSAVITAQGLVGYTYRVYERYSDVLTILDTNNRVDVVVDRTRTHGVVEGLSLMTCRMKYVPHSEEIFIGDVLVTAGLSLIYPKGIKLGEITNIKRSAEELTQDVTVKPAVDFTKLEEVVVLIAPSPIETGNIENHPVGGQKSI